MKLDVAQSIVKEVMFNYRVVCRWHVRIRIISAIVTRNVPCKIAFTGQNYNNFV